MLNEEQKTIFEEISAKHRAARSEYFERIRAMNDEAVEKTKALLTDQQRAKYETIIEHRRSGTGLGHHSSRHPKNH